VCLLLFAHFIENDFDSFFHLVLIAHCRLLQKLLEYVLAHILHRFDQLPVLLLLAQLHSKAHYDNSGKPTAFIARIFMNTSLVLSLMNLLEDICQSFQSFRFIFYQHLS
jgi:hypothetical protein